MVKVIEKLNTCNLKSKPPINIMGAIITQPTKIESKYTINIDWFEATVMGVILPSYIEEPLQTISYDNDNIVLKYAKYGTKHFKYVYDVYFANEKESFATIQTAPRAKILDSLMSIIKIENYCLYSEGWTSKFEYLREALGVEVNNITRLDIATDGRGFRSMFEKVDNGSLSIVGRAKLNAHGTEVINGVRKADSYVYGTAKSSKQISIYHKGISIEEQNKQYIANFWLKNGLIANYEQREEIERAELRLYRKAINLIVDNEMIDETTGDIFTGVQITRLEDPAYLASIKKAHMKSYCEFVSSKEKAQRGNVSRCKVISLIDWSELNAKTMQRLKTTQKPSTVWRAKRCASFLLEMSKDESPLMSAIEKHLAANDINIPPEIFKGLSITLAESIAKNYDFSEYLHYKMLRKIAPLIELKQAV